MPRYGNCRKDTKRTILKEIDELKESINHFSKAIETDKEISSNESKKNSFKKYINRTETELRKKELRLKKGDYRQDSLSKPKNIDLKTLNDIVLKYIEIECKHSKWLTKESIAKKYNVKECLVEQVFKQLNLEGILSQRHPFFAHETFRNPAYTEDGGWAEDRYFILEKIIK